MSASTGPAESTDPAASAAPSGFAFPDLLVALGLASTVVSFGGVVASMLLSPWFSVFDHALSDLGVAGSGTALLFNGSLLIGGALGAGFVVAVWAVVDHPIRQAALVVMLPAMVCMALVGAFPIPAALHGPVAIGFFGFMTVGLFLWGAGDYATGRLHRGAAMVAAAAIHAVSWAWWLTLGWLPPGIAIPELIGAVALAVWTLWLVADAWRGLAARSDRPLG